MLDDRVACGRHLGLVAYVDGEGDRAPADLLRSFASSGLVDVGDQHGVAARGQQGRDLSAQPSPGAGDDGAAALRRTTLVSVGLGGGHSVLLRRPFGCRA